MLFMLYSTVSRRIYHRSGPPTLPNIGSLAPTPITYYVLAVMLARSIEAHAFEHTEESGSRLHAPIVLVTEWPYDAIENLLELKSYVFAVGDNEGIFIRVCRNFPPWCQ